MSGLDGANFEIGQLGQLPCCHTTRKRNRWNMFSQYAEDLYANEGLVGCNWQDPETIASDFHRRKKSEGGGEEEERILPSRWSKRQRRKFNEIKCSPPTTRRASSSASRVIPDSMESLMRNLFAFFHFFLPHHTTPAFTCNRRFGRRWRHFPSIHDFLYRVTCCTESPFVHVNTCVSMSASTFGWTSSIADDLSSAEYWTNRWPTGEEDKPRVSLTWCSKVDEHISELTCNLAVKLALTWTLVVAGQSSLTRSVDLWQPNLESFECNSIGRIDRPIIDVDGQMALVPDGVDTKEL